MAIARQRIRLPRGTWRQALAAWWLGELWDGDDLERFERDFAAAIGVPEAVTVPSGRAGLRFLFDALELEPGSEVICSAFGYPVVPHLARSLGFRLSFVDCELGTLGMDPEALAKAISHDTGAVIATHLYGVPCRIREIAEIAEAHGAVLIEDCAHCLGAAVGDRKVGAFGAAGYFSFETSKQVNTMGGGMITTRDARVAQRVRDLAREQPRQGLAWLLERLFRTTFEATVTHPLVFDAAVYPSLRLAARRRGTEQRFASGYHADDVTMQGRMGRYTNFQARLGWQQLEVLAPRIERRRANAERLLDRLRGHVPLQEPAGPDATADYMLVTTLFPRSEEAAQRLLAAGVDTKRHYMRDCSQLLDGEQSFPNAARAEREVLHVPAYPELADAQIDRVAERVRGVAAGL